MKILKFTVNEQIFIAPSQFLTGKQIKEMAKIPADVDLFLVVPGYMDELINDEKVVNMARPGIERFVARKHMEQEIIVNGRRMKFANDNISYDEVVHLAFPQPASQHAERGYTIVYANGPEKNPNGILPPGAVVYVKHNMKFDVTPTHKS
jgi:hypothetical protein